MCADASGPKHSTGEPGFTVSGVLIPSRRTVVSRPATNTWMVSPSTTRSTGASVTTGPRGDRPLATGAIELTDDEHPTSTSAQARAVQKPAAVGRRITRQ